MTPETAATTEVPKLRVENIRKTFFRVERDRVTAVEALGGVSFTVRSGEFVSVIGPSGCGKSTLLRIIDGLVAADEGGVFVDGKKLTGPGHDRAVVFQYFGLYPWRTVQKNVEFGLELQGVPVAERRERARRNIALVGLSGFENHYPHELSGGMKQRVGFARALTMDPDIILMDEPFSAVDEQTRELLQEQLLDVWEKMGKTVVFITHSIDEAVFLADRVIVMGARPGRIVETVAVDLPRPRTSAHRASPRLLEIRTHAWETLRRGIIEAKAGLEGVG
ncbi:MAG: ABC transporter ATP-binding protein [Rhodobacteraceae bacterium]|jgi:NitT/TauT family transport system ATP-binding protein|nr:ABC transporter ATP-binding protein [Paracoccaceae bacterium]